MHNEDRRSHLQNSHHIFLPYTFDNLTNYAHSVAARRQAVQSPYHHCSCDCNNPKLVTVQIIGYYSISYISAIIFAVHKLVGNTLSRGKVNTPGMSTCRNVELLPSKLVLLISSWLHESRKENNKCDNVQLIQSDEWHVSCSYLLHVACENVIGGIMKPLCSPSSKQNETHHVFWLQLWWF